MSYIFFQFILPQNQLLMLKYLYLNMLILCELILHNSLFQLVASLFSLRDERVNLCLIMNEIKKGDNPYSSELGLPRAFPLPSYRKESTDE